MSAIEIAFMLVGVLIQKEQQQEYQWEEILEKFSTKFHPKRTSQDLRDEYEKMEKENSIISFIEGAKGILEHETIELE